MDGDDEFNVLGGYFPSVVQHLKDTRARLGRRAGSQTNEDRSVADDAEDAVEPHTHSGWTPTEQDAFFRATSVHSRWRPDLIAACVPTKTEWEVWMYLEALEEGVVALTAQGGDEDVDMDMEDDQDAEMEDDGSASGSLPPEDRYVDEDVREPALEVSQGWIEAEERMASWIIEGERLASLGNNGLSDIVEAGDKPWRGRQKARKGRVQSTSREQIVPKSNQSSPFPIRHSPSPEPTSTSGRHLRNPSTTLAGKREALMARLELPHLLVLDSILRADEEGMVERSKSLEGCVAAAALTEQGGDGATRAHDGDLSSLSDRITGPSGTSSVPESLSNVATDPVLLGLSGGADPEEPYTQGSSSSINFPEPTSPDAVSPPGGSDSSAGPQDNAAPDNPDTSANAESDLSLSPRSRRRIRKRLYMRRKRALLLGDDVGPESAVDTGSGKLKPGKKAGVERTGASVVSTSVPRSEAPDDEAELPGNVPKKNKPGLTLPYKLKATFAELGVDAAYLRGQGMDLLSLGALGKLMGLYFSLEHNEEKEYPSGIAGSIDAQLIRYLQASTVSFVTDVVHRAIVWREKEIRLKQRSRVWRHGDQITIGTIEHVVEAMGARHHSHKAYFQSLEALHGSTALPTTAAEPNPRDTSVDLDVGTVDLSGELPRISTHRDMYTPVVSPPSAWGVSTLACLAQTYEREAARTRRGTSAEIDEDALMLDETDEEALEAELVAEDELDGADMALSATHEALLWAGVRKNK